VSRDEPRRRDWWLVGCAVFAVALAASTTAVVVSDEGIANSTFVAPGPPAATPTPSHLLSGSTDAVPPERPDTGGMHQSTRSR
jgi:hypothetical protein